MAHVSEAHLLPAEPDRSRPPAMVVMHIADTPQVSGETLLWARVCLSRLTLDSAEV
jgi:hypothetical protein